METIKIKKEQKEHSRWSIVICAVFCLLLFGTSLFSILKPIKSFSENENRFLAKKPEFTKESFLSGQYAAEYETFITDQFPVRNQWITLKTWTERMLLKQESNGVYFGKDNYLIETHQASELDTEQLATNTERLIQFLSKATKLLGKEHVKMMLVPTANMIVTDKLPPFATGFDQFAYLGQVKEKLAKEQIEQVQVDVSDILLEHKKEDIFYRTDHHWTALGAYYAYTVWAKSCGFDLVPLESYDRTEISNDFYGTIYSKVNIKVKPDTIAIYEPKEKKTYQVEYNLGEKTTDTLYEMAQLKGKDKYAVFLGGNNAVVKIKQELSNAKRGKLLIIKDSYAHCFTPFVLEHYQEVEMIDLRYFNMSVLEYIDINGYDDVLFLYNIPNFAKDRNMSNLR